MSWASTALTQARFRDLGGSNPVRPPTAETSAPKRSKPHSLKRTPTELPLTETRRTNPRELFSTQRADERIQNSLRYQRKGLVEMTRPFVIGSDCDGFYDGSRTLDSQD